MALGHSELEKFEAEMAKPPESPAGKKNGKQSEKLPSITAQDANESSVTALIDRVTVTASNQINSCRKELDRLEQELLESAARQKAGLVSHITTGLNVETATAAVKEAVEGMRAQHARVVGANT